MTSSKEDAQVISAAATAAPAKDVATEAEWAAIDSSP
jgi:hypothetical protein